MFQRCIQLLNPYKELPLSENVVNRVCPYTAAVESDEVAFSFPLDVTSHFVVVLLGGLRKLVRISFCYILLSIRSNI